MKRHVFVKKIESSTRTEAGVVFHCRTDEEQAIDLELTVCTPHIVRLRMCADPALQEYESLLEVRREWPATEFEISEADDEVIVDTGALRFGSGVHAHRALRRTRLLSL